MRTDGLHSNCQTSSWSSPLYFRHSIISGRSTPQSDPPQPCQSLQQDNHQASVSQFSISLFTTPNLVLVCTIGICRKFAKTSPVSQFATQHRQFKLYNHQAFNSYTRSVYQRPLQLFTSIPKSTDFREECFNGKRQSDSCCIEPCDSPPPHVSFSDSIRCCSW